ncbi:outer membrane protein transport protein [Kistimonas scapharcae]|uniref:Outer membrane protein transport protein n=1 Tax=Kistimonas scapharcae TaxID=1036133 RepID=A0ABP8V8Y0_9GAMM
MNFRPYPGKLSLVSLAVSACIASGVAQGAGFALNELSAGAAGTANAGRAANPEDASILSSNPAGLAHLEGSQWTVGGALVIPKADLKNASGTNTLPAFNNAGNGDGGDFMSAQFVPSAYFSTQLDDKWSAGFGIYVPFAAATDYDDNFAGRYLATKTELTNINLQPTIAYKFSDRLSVGVGVFASHMEGTLNQMKRVPSGNINPFPGYDAKSSMEGDDWSWGWNVGVIWQPTDRTNIGMSYTSKVDFTVEGEMTLVGGDGSGGYGPYHKTNGHIDLTLPEKFEIGVTHQLDDRWTLMAGALWTRWSQFDEIVAIDDEGNMPGIDPGAPASYVPENWKDSWAWSVGASYKYDEQWTLKGGYAYDNSPVRNEWRTARIPDVDREWLTIGAKYQPNQDYVVDMAYGYMLKKDTKVNESAHPPAGSIDGASFSGDYEMSAHVLMISLTRRF